MSRYQLNSGRTHSTHWTQKARAKRDIQRVRPTVQSQPNPTVSVPVISRLLKSVLGHRQTDRQRERGWLMLQSCWSVKLGFTAKSPTTHWT